MSDDSPPTPGFLGQEIMFRVEENIVIIRIVQHYEPFTRLVLVQSLRERKLISFGIVLARKVGSCKGLLICLMDS